VRPAASERSDAAKEAWAFAYFLRRNRSAFRGADLDEITEVIANLEAEITAAIEAGLTDGASIERATERLSSIFEHSQLDDVIPTKAERAGTVALTVKLLRDDKLLRLAYTPPVVRRPEGRSRSCQRRIRRRASRAAARDGPDGPADDPDPDLVRARRGWSR
jgi:hypothetical protein